MLIAKIVKKTFQQYWRLSRGLSLGVKAIVLDGDGRVLLACTQDVGEWALPQTSVQRGETAEDALRRMLNADLSMALEAPADLVGIAARPGPRPDGHWVVLAVSRWRRSETAAGHTASRPQTRWFDATQLPADLDSHDDALIAQTFAPKATHQKG